MLLKLRLGELHSNLDYIVQPFILGKDGLNFIVHAIHYFHHLKKR